MFPRKFRFSFHTDTAIAAAFAVIALTVSVPSGAMAGTAARNASAAYHTSNAASTTTDISAAQRRHYAHRGSVRSRAAYGSYIGGPVYEPPAYSGGQSFGYGVGDNSSSYAQ
jgi:hypothetical protein